MASYKDVPHGVYLVDERSGRRHAHFGNHPIRRIELERRYPDAKIVLVAIYQDREEARTHRDQLNRRTYTLR